MIYKQSWSFTHSLAKRLNKDEYDKSLPLKCFSTIKLLNESIECGIKAKGILTMNCSIIRWKQRNHHNHEKVSYVSVTEPF